MKIHEYQAKEILRRYGVATPRGRVTDSPDEAAKICEELGRRCVVKAQIHAGGRGKGGGVKLAKSPEEAREVASQDPRHAARHPSDRPRRAARAQGARRGDGGHRPGAVPLHHPRPGPGQTRHHGVQPGRHGHRGGRGQGPEGDLPAGRRSPSGDRAVPGPGGCERAGLERADSGQGGEARHRAGQGLSGYGRLARRDQSR